LSVNGSTETQVNSMPSIISHPAIAIAARMIGGTERVSARLFVAAIIASILPDVDAIGFRLGIAYGNALGHRGFSHSIAFALIIGLLGMLLASRLRSGRIAVFLVLFISIISHDVLDAMTNGGLGTAFFSPFSNERFFLPWQPIQVAPLSIRRFLGTSGWKVLYSEFVWIWLPSLALGLIGMLCRKMHRFR
jgi:inner membrane protein